MPNRKEGRNVRVVVIVVLLCNRGLRQHIIVARSRLNKALKHHFLEILKQTNTCSNYLLNILISNCMDMKLNGNINYTYVFRLGSNHVICKKSNLELVCMCK